MTARRIAFIEDDETYRVWLTAIVTSAATYEIVGAFASTDEAMRQLPDAGADLVVIDVHLRGHSGIPAIPQLHHRWPSARCVMLTGSEADADLFPALEAGAIGYLLKTDSPRQILAALDEVAAGGAALSRSIGRRVLKSFSGKAAPKGVAVGASVTRREHEILDRLAAGATYKEIGRALGISPATVKNHLSRIYAKLAVRSRTEAVVKWLKR